MNSRMNRKEIEVLLDMMAFIHYAVLMRDRFGYPEVLGILAHDLRGLMNEEKCFLPRTHNYLRHLNNSKMTLQYNKPGK